MLNVRLAGDHLYGEIAVHLAVAGDVFDGVFYAVLFPTRCLRWDLGINWVSFWGFSYLLFDTIYFKSTWAFNFSKSSLECFRICIWFTQFLAYFKDHL